MTSVSFGDRVRVRATPETEARGVAGLVGLVLWRDDAIGHRVVAIGFRLVLASALLVPIHFLLGDRSFAHIVLQLVALLVFFVTLSIGWLAARKQWRLDERRSRFFEPALAALCIGIVHGLCTPLPSVLR